MKIAGKIKKGSAWLLALTFMLSGMVGSTVQAASGIETDRVCSVSFVLDGDIEEEFIELKSLPVSVKLYRVAEVDVSGDYTALEGYEDLGLDGISSETTAADWEAMGKKASETVKALQAEPDAEGTLENGAGKIEGLAVGMYLVEADTIRSQEYEYKFTPYLLSLPNNYYSTDGNDEWVYDVTAGLKPGKESLLGSLVIDKTLNSYNTTLGPATFVFKVEAEKDHEILYSNVVSLVFDGTGTRSLTIDKLPAGAQVTVTEVYSGASYQLTTESSHTVTILTEGAEGSPVHVSFGNAYNGQLNGGASVVNRFTNEEGVWDWQPQTDSSADQN